MNNELLLDYVNNIKKLNLTILGQVEGLELTLETLIITLGLESKSPNFLNELSNGIEAKAYDHCKYLSQQDEGIEESFTQTIARIQQHINQLNSYISAEAID